MAFTNKQLQIIEVENHLIDNIWYKYQTPITIKYSLNDRILISHSPIGVKSIAKLYWPPDFVN